MVKTRGFRGANKVNPKQARPVSNEEGQLVVLDALVDSGGERKRLLRALKNPGFSQGSVNRNLNGVLTKKEPCLGLSAILKTSRCGFPYA